MSVYVDDMQARFGRMVMCHMVADSTEELLAMADRIGIARRWMQKPGTQLEHFDISLTKRSLAVKNGAIEVTRRELATVLRQARAALATPPPVPAAPTERFDRSWWHYADDCPVPPERRLTVERVREAIKAAYNDGIPSSARLVSILDDLATVPPVPAAPPLDVEQVGPDDEWPGAVSDGLALACSDCGAVPRFDYSVSDDFWRRWAGDDRLGVICLPCLDRRCNGVGLAEALEQVQWTGSGHTVVLAPSRRIDYAARLSPVQEEAPDDHLPN